MTTPLSIALRALGALQRHRLGTFGQAFQRVAAMRLNQEERAAGAPVDDLRRALTSDHSVLRVEDYGAGTRGVVGPAARVNGRRVADIYHRAAATPSWGRFLFCLVRELRPTRALELGTNLGVSAAHIATALRLNGSGRLWTIEGDPGLAGLARAGLARVGVADLTDVVVGRFRDVLPEVCDEHGPFDLVFLDGHHEEAATLEYWRMLRPHLAPGATVLFDDIEPGRPVRRAWSRIVRDECASIDSWADLLGLGMLILGGESGRPRAGAADRAHLVGQ